MKKPGRTSNPNVGTHGSGGQLARPGAIGGSQAEPRGNRPITASRSAMRPQPGVLANQAETSKDLQERIDRNPQPFIKQGAATLPAPSNTTFKQGISYERVTPVNAKTQSYGTHIGCGNTATTDDMLADVGEPRLPKGYNEINNYRGSAGKKQAGRPGNSSKGTSAKENRRVRQTGY
jgi:hypothetical protein